MRIFVTGATGYLGYHFVNAAIRNGHSILCLRRKSSKSLFSENIENLICWVEDDKDLEKKILSFSPDILFHAAWSGVRGSGRDNMDIQNDNINLTRRMIRLYPYKQVIGIGSQAEYGFYSNIISEDYPLRPSTEYAKAKVKCCKDIEIYCQHNGIEWQWVRIFTVFGEKQTGGLIKIAIENCLSRESVFRTTLGEQKYSYLYAYDFAKAICNILGVVGKSGIYNLSQPLCLHSNRDILTYIKELTQSNIEFDFGAIPYSENQVMLMDGKVDRFEKAFGKIPYTDFELAIKNTINSFSR